MERYYFNSPEQEKLRKELAKLEERKEIITQELEKIKNENWMFNHHDCSVNTGTLIFSSESYNWAYAKDLIDTDQLDYDELFYFEVTDNEDYGSLTLDEAKNLVEYLQERIEYLES